MITFSEAMIRIESAESKFTTAARDANFLAQERDRLLGERKEVNLVVLKIGYFFSA